MRTSSTTVPRTVFFALPVVAVAWLVAVPGFLTLSSFFVLVGLLAASAWILKTTYSNAQPASSLAQTLHDADAVARERARKVR